MICPLNWTWQFSMGKWLCWLTKRCIPTRFPYELMKSPLNSHGYLHSMRWNLPSNPSVSSGWVKIPQNSVFSEPNYWFFYVSALCTSCVQIHLPSLTLRLAHLQGDAVAPQLNRSQTSKDVYVWDVCVYIHVRIYMYTCMYVCMYVWMNEWMYEWMNEWMNVWMNECMYVCMYVCMYNYVYIYIYTHICTYICIYKYIHV